MSRSTVVYLVMIVALVGGLWAVLAIGGRLTPPEDLAGAWTVDSAAGPVDLYVEQSGRFFQLTYKGTTVDLQRDGSATSPTHLVGGGRKWTAEFAPGPTTEDRIVRITGPNPLDGPAHRVRPRYRSETEGAK